MGSRSTSPLETLPPELLRLILEHLPIASLLAFARTRKFNYVSATQNLITLELAVLPKQLHTKLAFVSSKCHESLAESILAEQSSCSSDSEPRWPLGLAERRQGATSVWRRVSRDQQQYAVGLASNSLLSAHGRSLPIVGIEGRRASSSSAVSIRNQEIMLQNAIAETVLSSSSVYNLESLTLHLYDLSASGLASLLATSFPNIRHLHLNFSHPYINDTTLPPRYWRNTPTSGSGSPVWNYLCGVGDANSSSLKLRSLRSLTLQRSSVTSFQLRSWIQNNPLLQNLYLEKVRGVDIDFCAWLGDYIALKRREVRGSIEVIALESCGELVCESEADFKWISQIAGTADDVASHSLAARTTEASSSVTERVVVDRRLVYLSLKSCLLVNEGVFCSLAGATQTDLKQRNNNLADAVAITTATPPSSTAVSNGHVLSSTQSTSRPSSSTSSLSIGMTSATMRLWREGIKTIVSPRGTVITKSAPVHRNDVDAPVFLAEPPVLLSSSLSTPGPSPGPGPGPGPATPSSPPPLNAPEDRNRNENDPASTLLSSPQNTTDALQRLPTRSLHSHPQIRDHIQATQNETQPLTTATSNTPHQQIRPSSRRGGVTIEIDPDASWMDL